MIRRSTKPLATLAVVVALVVSGIVGAGAVVAQTSPPADDEYAVIQGDRCIPIEPIGQGHQTVEEYYDHRMPDDEPGGLYSSYGTTHLQENDTSIMFLHEGEDGLSLVIVHDRFDRQDNTTGGAATFHFENLPEEGEWVVQDDNYAGDDSTSWERDGSSSEISWSWADGRTDGAAFNGGLDDGFDIELTPAFNERADIQLYDGWITDWQVISGPEHDVDRTTMNAVQPITITSNGCSSFTVAELTVNDTAMVGDSVEVEATIENEGPESGTHPVQFTLDGDTIDEREISLEPGESTTVSTTVEPDEAGTYEVGVVDETAELTVEEEEGEEEEPESEPESEPDDDEDELVGFGVTAAALAAFLVALVARYRR